MQPSPQTTISCRATIVAEARRSGSMVRLVVVSLAALSSINACSSSASMRLFFHSIGDAPVRLETTFQCSLLRCRSFDGAAYKRQKGDLRPPGGRGMPFCIYFSGKPFIINDMDCHQMRAFAASLRHLSVVICFLGWIFRVTSIVLVFGLIQCNRDQAGGN